MYVTENPAKGLTLLTLTLTLSNAAAVDLDWTMMMMLEMMRMMLCERLDDALPWRREGGREGGGGEGKTRSRYQLEQSRR